MSRNNGTAATAPTQINPSAVYAELRNRLQNADYFGRIALAAKLLNHRPWVVAPDGGGGDVSTAIDRLEADCFPDVCGPWYGLATLLELADHFPDPQEWVRRKNNIKSMVADMQAAKAGKKNKPDRKPQPRTRDANAKVDRFLSASPSGMATMFQQELVKVEKVESELDKLRTENDTLRRENAELRKENQRLKAYVNRIQNIAV